MAAGLPDLVDCKRLAQEAAVLERVYLLRDLPRLEGVLADRRGEVHARYAFATLPSGRPGLKLAVRATPSLECQRCMQGFDLEVRGGSDIEFAGSDDADRAESDGELFGMDNGLASLRELAEEEVLLALPIAPACRSPTTCGRAPGYATGEATQDGAGEMRRPFSALQDLLKKT